MGAVSSPRLLSFSPVAGILFVERVYPGKKGQLRIGSFSPVAGILFVESHCFPSGFCTAATRGFSPVAGSLFVESCFFLDLFIIAWWFQSRCRDSIC